MVAKELDFSHVRKHTKPELNVDHVSMAWRDIQFERYLKQTYFEKLRSIKNRTYNPNRALRAF